ncbi:hypothetical protein [Legionella sp.]|uniref:hypothetical protein n=1 Tax=Legionella sp. TaxID=459 RepID=UPI00321FE45C
MLEYTAYDLFKMLRPTSNSSPTLFPKLKSFTYLLESSGLRVSSEEKVNPWLYFYNEKTERLMLIQPPVYYAGQKDMDTVIEFLIKKEVLPKKCPQVVLCVLGEDDDFPGTNIKYGPRATFWDFSEFALNSDADYEKIWSWNSSTRLEPYSLNVFMRIFRYLEYLCGEYNVFSRSPKTEINRQHYEGFAKVLDKQAKADLKKLESFERPVTLERIQQVVKSDNDLIRILQITQETALKDISEFEYLKRELLRFKEIYTLRTEQGINYLGIFGLFGSFTAQEKLHAVTKFLEDETQPLEEAAEQGELGKLITAYQEAKKQMPVHHYNSFS